MTYSKELKIKAEIAEAIENEISSYERMLEWEKNNKAKYASQCEEEDRDFDEDSANYYNNQIKIAEENLEACKKIVADLLKKL